MEISITYFLSAFTFASFAYAAISVPVTHIRGMRAHLSKWLNDNYTESWATSFCVVFDWFFGERIFCLKRVIKSAIVSLLSVACIYILFSEVLHVLEFRASTDLSVISTLSIAIFVNIIADFFSLAETRWVLEKFKQSRNTSKQFLWFLFDLLSTLVIIWISISAYLFVKGGRAVSIPELAGAFSVYSVLFYSTFITSIWSIGYMISSTTCRILTDTRIGRKIEIDENPGGSLGLIFGLLSFIAFLCASFVLNPDEKGRTYLDRGLCKLFPGSTCLHAARISENPDARWNYFANACFFDREGMCTPETIFKNSKALCDQGISWSCATAGISHLEGQGTAQNYPAAASAFRRGCDLGAGWSCGRLGDLHREGKGLLQDLAMAATAYQKGCTLKRAYSCEWLAIAYRDGKGRSQDYSAATSLLKQGCELDSAWSCFYLGTSYRDGAGIRQSPVAAATSFRKGCILGSAESCLWFGLNLSNGAGVTRDYPKAASFFRKACNLENGPTCGRLGLMYRDGTGVGKSLSAAAIQFKKGCGLNDGWSCGWLGVSYRDGYGLPRDIIASKSAMTKGCSLGDEFSCRSKNSLIMQDSLSFGFPVSPFE